MFGLKQINGNEGHAAGDAAIRAATGVLKNGAGNGDVLARMGEDETEMGNGEAPEAGAHAKKG